MEAGLQPHVCAGLVEPIQMFRWNAHDLPTGKQAHKYRAHLPGHPHHHQQGHLQPAGHYEQDYRFCRNQAGRCKPCIEDGSGPGIGPETEPAQLSARLPQLRGGRGVQAVT